MAFGMGTYAAYPTIHTYLKTHTFLKLDSYSNYSFIIRKSSSIIIGGVFSVIVSHPLHLAQSINTQH